MNPGIYHVFSNQNNKNRRVGRFLVHGGQVHHLEDWHRLLGSSVPAGPVDAVTEHMTRYPSPGIGIAHEADLVGGHRLDLIPEHPLDKALQEPEPEPEQPKLPAAKPSVFSYLRAGYDSPHVLEVRDGTFLLDGNRLTHPEVHAMLGNVRTGAAKLRYPRETGQAVKKAELAISDLAKSFESSDDALAHLDSLELDPKGREAVAIVRKQLYEDPMVPGLGNKFAYEQFQRNPRAGVTVMGDANYFKNINDLYGHDVGDSAIKALGSAWRDAAQAVGQGKAHRFGGDEFHAHFPSHEHATRFARELRSRLEQIPMIGGSHRLSMSLGTGPTPSAADKSLYQAKALKGAHTPATIPHLLVHGVAEEGPGISPAEKGMTEPEPRSEEPAQG